LALALPDEEVQQLVKSSSTFKNAEERILRVWGDLPKDVRSQVRQSQVDWIKTGRDNEANLLMDKGYSKADAYAEVTNKRSDYLESLVGKGPLSQASSSGTSSTSTANNAQSSTTAEPTPPTPVAASNPAPKPTPVVITEPLIVPKVPPRPDIAAITSRAEGGDAKAWLILSELHYMAGREYRAQESADKAAKLDEPVGIARGALMRYLKADTNAKKEQALKELQSAWTPLLKAAEAGDAPAMNVIGEIYQIGVQNQVDASFFQGLFGGSSELEPDMAQALDWLQKSANSGNALGKLLLGRLYFSGNGVKEDPAKAMQLFREIDPLEGPIYGLTSLAEEGNLDAIMTLAELYGYQGEMEKSFQWVSKAAQTGNPEAIFYLGRFHEVGAGGVQEDIDEAVRLYKKAAEEGYLEAWLHLTFIAANGQGIDKDFRLARSFLDSAAKSGFDPQKIALAISAVDNLEIQAEKEKQEQLAREIKRQEEERQKKAEEEYRRAEEERRLAEENERQRQREEEERRNAQACAHVYVGKVFTYRGGIFQMEWQTEVIGFSPTTQQVTIRDTDGYTQTVSCSAIPE
jgi:TPR repeat protein